MPHRVIVIRAYWQPMLHGEIHGGTLQVQHVPLHAHIAIAEDARPL
jgi:hypothetical protein